MKKICIVITNRSSWGRYQAVCEAIHNHPKLELQLVVAGGALHLDIPYNISDRLYCLIDGDSKESMVLTTTTLTTQLVGVFTRLKPDIVYIHGDRFEMLGVAMASSYMGIPIAHAEGGEVTGCIDDKVRNSISFLSDTHFVVTNESYSRLNNMMKVLSKPTNIYKVGSPALDLLVNLPSRIIKEEYVVVLVHPETTVNEDIDELIEALKSVKEKIIWVNPNFDAGSKEMLKKIHKTGYQFVKDLNPKEFYSLLKYCKCLIGNTSSGIKEGSFLGVPYICIGNRQANREISYNVKSVEYIADSIIKAYENIEPVESSWQFGYGDSSIKIAKILAGE